MTLPPDPPDFATPIGYSVFCEDIRHEHDGKFSLMGAFQGNLSVPAFPCVLPKLGICTFYRQPPSFPRARVDIAVVWDPEGGARRPIVVTPMDMTQMEVPGDEEAWLGATGQIVISPFQVTEPGVLRVRAYREDREPLRMGAVRIVVAAPPERGPQSPLLLPFAEANEGVVAPTTRL